MVANHYSYVPKNSEQCAKARGVDLRVHFKNTVEVAHAVRGMSLTRAKAYLKNVIRQKEIVPFRHFNGKVGRKAQCKNHKLATQGRWPEKSCRYVLDVLRNAQANAEANKLDLAKCYIHSIVVQRAIKQRRRTYRAHGRIGPYMCNPSHIEVVLRQKSKTIKKAGPKKVKKTAKAE